jgi:hypothetical protein
MNDMTTEIEITYGEYEETIYVEVTYTVEGEDTPATWGYHGGEPADYAQAEVSKIVVLNDEAEGGFEEGHELELEEAGLRALEDKLMQDLIDEAAYGGY